MVEHMRVPTSHICSHHILNINAGLAFQIIPQGSSQNEQYPRENRGLEICPRQQSDISNMVIQQQNVQDKTQNVQDRTTPTNNNNNDSNATQHTMKTKPPMTTTTVTTTAPPTTTIENPLSVTSLTTPSASSSTATGSSSFTPTTSGGLGPRVNDEMRCSPCD